jgi:uncharacterized protein YkwD
MHSFSLLSLCSIAIHYKTTYARCDDCWYWPEDDAVFQQEIMDATNSYRAQHNANPLEWNETIADEADGYVYGCKSVIYVSLLAQEMYLGMRERRKSSEDRYI